MPRTLFGCSSPSLTAMQYAVYTGGIPYAKLYYLCDPGKWKLRSMQSTIRTLKEKGFLDDAYVSIARNKNMRVLLPTPYTFEKLPVNELFIGSDSWFSRQQKMARRHITSNAASAQQRRKTLSRMLSTADEVLFTRYVFKLMESYQNDVTTVQKHKWIKDNYAFLKEYEFKQRSSILPGTKPDIHSTCLSEENTMCYMTAYEIKSELDKFRVRAEAGRAQGYIFEGAYNSETCTGGYNLTFYSMSRASLEMKAGHENDTRRLINGILHQCGNGFLNGDIIMAPMDMFTETLIRKPLTSEMRVRKEGRNPYYIDLNQQGSHLRSWFIPYSDEGARILAMLLSPSGEETLKLIPMATKEGLSSGSLTLIHDFYSGSNNTYYLSFLVPDLYRLKRYVTAASTCPNEKFVIICFDIYEKALRDYLEQTSMSNISLEVTSLYDIQRKYLLVRPEIHWSRIKKEHGITE